MRSLLLLATLRLAEGDVDAPRALAAMKAAASGGSPPLALSLLKDFRAVRR